MKEIIVDEIEETKVILNQFKEITKPVSPDNSIGRLSRMEALGSKSTAEFSERQAKNKLSDLETQLLKIDSDDFGKCQNCKELIPIERLFFMPESLFCVSCSKK
ncbi:TraR/DksA C4-type zinc finger protein [Candidatus Kapabacteria bacterium]|nr:TraR/DksA C4-type zinc finger protein [Candidatus Kapabacteria bacterium]